MEQKRMPQNPKSESSVKKPMTVQQRQDLTELAKSIEKLPPRRRKVLEELLNKKLLDSKEVCEILGVSLATVRRWLARGEIKSVKVSRFIKFPSEEIFRLVQHQEALSVPQVAQILGVGILTIRNMIKRGEINAFRISGTGHYRIARGEIERIIHGGC